MVTLLPLDGSFIRFAGRFVDEAFGMAAGYNCTWVGCCLSAAAAAAPAAMAWVCGDQGCDGAQRGLSLYSRYPSALPPSSCWKPPPPTPTLHRPTDFVSQAALICFEINIFNTVIGYVSWCFALLPHFSQSP